LLAEWKAERAAFLQEHPKPWDEALYDDYARRFERRLERWSDEGHGACHLRQPDLRSVMTTALRHFDGERYDLIGFVVMPNHVHVLLRPYVGTEAEDETTRERCAADPELLNPTSLAGVLRSWKGYTAREINQRLGRQGALWMDESFDHAVRSGVQMERFRQYIAENPVKARLPTSDYELWLAEGECCGLSSLHSPPPEMTRRRSSVGRGSFHSPHSQTCSLERPQHSGRYTLPAQDACEVGDLFVHLGGIFDEAGDFFSEQLAVALA
jgi:REP element-mobilizing transposase RayT